MTLKNLAKAPFPYFGGKSKAAPLVWSLLGDVPHYVEPFAGSLAVLLGRPHLANRPYVSETVNDVDALLVNAWRAIQQHPDATAEHASWPVTETDKMARQLALVNWRESESAAHLAGDADWCDVRMAGWWLWGVAIAIGATWCNGGPWVLDERGYAVRRPRAGSTGVRGVRPHLTNGQGVNRPGVREPGVSRVRPHLSDNGQGVNRPGVREPGVTGVRPHLGDNGVGVNHPGTREPGVHALDPDEFHPMTMPELRRWFAWLSARLRWVRIVNGDWRRVVTTGASMTLPVRHGDGPCGVFLDPPYADTADRDMNMYVHDSGTVAHDAREWALTHGDDTRYRIVFAGFDGEHDTRFTDAGWTEHEWFTQGHLAGGMGNLSDDGHQQHRERLWASPHCLTAEPADNDQLSLWGDEDAT